MRPIASSTAAEKGGDVVRVRWKGGGGERGQWAISF